MKDTGPNPYKLLLLAALVLAAYAPALIAVLVCIGPHRRWKAAYVAAFVCVNIGYLWLVKDGQYVKRAAPTARLAAALRTMVPQPVLVSNFPENPWIGANTALTLPGWSPSLVRVNQPPGACPACPRLTWDSGSGSYRVD